eukprot:scaffold2831_cov249-Ochromonas_danica.AAC.47
MNFADNKVRSELTLKVVYQGHRVEQLKEPVHEHVIELPEVSNLLLLISLVRLKHRVLPQPLE